MVIEGTIKHKSKIGYSIVTTRSDNPYPFSAASISPLFKNDSGKSRKLTKLTMTNPIITAEIIVRVIDKFLILIVLIMDIK